MKGWKFGAWIEEWEVGRGGWEQAPIGINFIAGRFKFNFTPKLSLDKFMLI